MFSDGQREGAIAAMHRAADLDDASEKSSASSRQFVHRALPGALASAVAPGIKREDRSRGSPRAVFNLRRRRRFGDAQQ